MNRIESESQCQVVPQSPNLNNALKSSSSVAAAGSPKSPAGSAGKQQPQPQFKRYRKKDKAKQKKKYLKGEPIINSYPTTPQKSSGHRTNNDSVVFYTEAEINENSGLFKTKREKQCELEEEEVLRDYLEHVDKDTSDEREGEDEDDDGVDRDTAILKNMNFADSLDHYYPKAIKNRLKKSKTHNKMPSKEVLDEEEEDEEIDMDLDITYKKRVRLERKTMRKTRVQNINPNTAMASQQHNSSSASGPNSKKKNRFSREITFVKSNTSLQDESTSIGMPDVPPPLIKRVSFTLPTTNDIIFLSSASETDISRSSTPMDHVNSYNSGSANFYYPQLNNSTEDMMDVDSSNTTSGTDISSIYEKMNEKYNNLGYDNVEEFEDEEESMSDDDMKDMAQSEEEFDDDGDTDMELPVFEISHYTQISTLTMTTPPTITKECFEDGYDSLTESDDGGHGKGKTVSNYINSEPSGDEGFYNPYKPKDQQAPKFYSGSSSASSCSQSFIQSHSHLFAPLCILNTSSSSSSSSMNLCNSSKNSRGSGNSCIDPYEVSDVDCNDSCTYVSSTEESDSYPEMEVSSKSSSFSDWIKKVHGTVIKIPSAKPNQELQISPRHQHHLVSSISTTTLPPQPIPVQQQQQSSQSSFSSVPQQQAKEIIDVDSEDNLESLMRRADARTLLFRDPLNSFILECLEDNNVLKKEILEINDKGIQLSTYSIKQLTSIANLFDYFIMAQNSIEFPLWTMSKTASHQVEFLARKYEIYSESRKVKDRNTIFILISHGTKKPSNKKKDNYILAAYSESGDYKFDTQKISPPKKNNTNTTTTTTMTKKEKKKDKKEKKKEKKKNKKNHSRNNSVDGDHSSSSRTSIVRHGEIVAGDVPPISASNVGHMLLTNVFGWGGGGLGAENNGVAEPIQTIMKKNRSGLGFD